jgi:hypothetical protein
VGEKDVHVQIQILVSFLNEIQLFNFSFCFSATQPVDEFQQELTQRLTGRVGTINQYSSSEDVQRWLAFKNVSPE